MEKELSSAELYKKDRGEFWKREHNITPEERKRIGDYERFEVQGIKVTIYRSLGETSIYEDYGMEKIRFPGFGEIEVDNPLTGHTILSTPMTPEEEKQRNEERFQILDRIVKEDLKNGHGWTFKD